jgi:alpha-tubulin suppressor-like RCC1 family protein
VNGDFIRIAAGAYHSAAVKTDGGLLIWGSSDRGQAGRGSGPQPHPM